MFFFLVSMANAGTLLFDQCLEAADLRPYAAELEAIGPGTVSETTGSATIATGVWTLHCAGNATFDQHSITTFTSPPVPNQVLSAGLPKEMLKCFLDACALPRDVCPGRNGDRATLEACSGDALDVVAFVHAGTPVADTPVTSPTLPDLESDTGETPVHGGQDAVTVVVAGKTIRTNPSTVSATASPTSPPPRSDRLRSEETVVLTLPSRPTTPCSVVDSLRKESKNRVALGNDAEAAGNPAHAANEYRAALALDPCSAWGWAAMGLLAGRAGRPDISAQALSIALDENPAHYTAAVELGAAYEILGQLQLAEEAYLAALSTRPEHTRAIAGLERVRAAVR